MLFMVWLENQEVTFKAAVSEDGQVKHLTAKNDRIKWSIFYSLQNPGLIY
jgi:hypothetical protein